MRPAGGAQPSAWGDKGGTRGQRGTRGQPQGTRWHRSVTRPVLNEGGSAGRWRCLDGCLAPGDTGVAPRGHGGGRPPAGAWGPPSFSPYPQGSAAPWGRDWGARRGVAATRDPPHCCAPKHRWPRTPQKPDCSGGASQPPSRSPSHGGPGVPPRHPASPHKRSRAMLAFPPVFPNVLGLIRSRSAFCATFYGPAVANLRSNVRAAGSFLLPAPSPSPRRLAPRARGRAGTPDLF